MQGHNDEPSPQNQTPHTQQPPHTPENVWAERPGAQQRNRADVNLEETLTNKKRQSKSEGDWERSVLEKLAFASLKEQRRARRWKLFFTMLFFVYIGFITWTVLKNSSLNTPTAAEHTAVVNIKGAIADDSEASARYVLRSLREAFEASNAKAVVLNINSPGGSPVQAGIIHDEIIRLKGLHKKPVHAVIGELGASAAYYIAVAADDIYVDKASMVGSIGVLMNGFGFTGTMEKLGVERRLLSAGDHKGFLDPFSPQNPADVNHAKRMLAQIHNQFIEVVRQGRGERLKETPTMFSGLVWTGEEAVQLGLADQLGSLYSVARDVVKADTLVDYTYKRGLADSIANRLGASFGASASSAAIDTIAQDSKHIWSYD
ncbi:S49 family peptidase [Lampropedia puyangensis]|uniref:S49 family peptidase n=1 Tax=Lampropedia puyangensis TaxID=1330072 RepID=A0A4S8EYA3_9BURK|nr:S49 family peptidase [Lampropedia puyangensis]THT99919.1 S49 family peptidase [Lampropedia puyangensis]